MIPTKFLHTRIDGRVARGTAAVRIFTGLVFVFFGALKFVAHDLEVDEFVKYGFSDPSLIVYLVGLLEVGGGLMLLLGIGTRLAALGLAINMAGAIATAGVKVGGWFHLGVAPALLAAMLYLLWVGSGSFSPDHRLATGDPVRPT